MPKDAKAVWTGERGFDVQVGSGGRLRVSTAEGTAGPMELVAAGLATCTGIDVIDILRKKRQDVTGLEVRVHGEQAEDYPRKFTHLQVTYVVTGRQVDPAAVRRSIELSEKKYCPVMASLRGSAVVETDFEVRESTSVPA